MNIMCALLFNLFILLALFEMICKPTVLFNKGKLIELLHLMLYIHIIMVSNFMNMPYSGKILSTINFAVFEGFAAASKINFSKSYYATEYYDSLVDPQKLIREIYH